MKWVIWVSWDIYNGIPNKMQLSAEPIAYPDDIDADKDVNGIVVRNVLKHSHVGVEAHVSGHVIRHFVHAQWALKEHS